MDAGRQHTDGDTLEAASQGHGGGGGGGGDLVVATGAGEEGEDKVSGMGSN